MSLCQGDTSVTICVYRANNFASRSLARVQGGDRRCHSNEALLAAENRVRGHGRGAQPKCAENV